MHKPAPRDTAESLHVHTLKSAQETTANDQPLQQIWVTPAGVHVAGVYDRSFTAAYWLHGRLRPITQQIESAIVRIRTDIQDDQIAFTVPGFGSHFVAANPMDGAQYELATRGDSLSVIDQGAEASKFLTEGLSRLDARDFGKILLVRADPRQPRQLLERHRRDGAVNQVASSVEHAPVTMVHKTDLSRLEAGHNMPPGSFPASRLRTTIISSGETAEVHVESWRTKPLQLAEDWVGAVAIGTTFAALAVGELPRQCAHLNTNQDTGELDTLGDQLLARRGSTEFGNPLGRVEKHLGLVLNTMLGSEESAVINVGDPIYTTLWRPPDQPHVVLAAA